MWDYANSNFRAGARQGLFAEEDVKDVKDVKEEREGSGHEEVHAADFGFPGKRQAKRLSVDHDLEIVQREDRRGQVRSKLSKTWGALQLRKRKLERLLSKDINNITALSKLSDDFG